MDPTNGVSDFCTKVKADIVIQAESIVLVLMIYLFLTALAEILSKRELPGGLTHYYVHYIDCEFEMFCVLLTLSCIFSRAFRFSNNKIGNF